MKDKRPFRKFARLVGVGASTLILAAWGMSLILGVQIRRPDFQIFCADGGIQVSDFYGSGRGDSGQPEWYELNVVNRSFGFELPEFERDADSFNLVVPFWTLLVLAVMPTALLFFLDRRRVYPGFCGACGYDLRSISGGRCPECGTSEDVRVQDWQKAELDRRKENLQQNPGSNLNWDEVKQRVRNRL